jgi:alpha-glucuronidase
VADLERPEWNPVYYHRADAQGIGFDRTTSGSNAVAQYAPRLARELADIDRVPERYLLWFHHVDWQHRMPSGRTLWEELVARYDRGVAAVEQMNATWQTLEAHIDAQRFAQTRQFLAVQLREAQWWRDACVAYFQQVSGLALPAGARAPAQSLEYYQSLQFPYAPGN